MLCLTSIGFCRIGSSANVNIDILWKYIDPPVPILRHLLQMGGRVFFLQLGEKPWAKKAVLDIPASYLIHCTISMRGYAYSEDNNMMLGSR